MLTLSTEIPLTRAFPARLAPVLAGYTSTWLSAEPASFAAGEELRVDGEALCLPYRLYTERRALVNSFGDESLPAAQHEVALALGSRHCDGFLRESCVRKLMTVRAAWLLPYLIAPLGEYVLEIGAAVLAGWDTLDAAALAKFAEDNPAFVARTRSRATSYWNCYYRNRYARLTDYPPWQALERLDQLARPTHSSDVDLQPARATARPRRQA